MWGLYFVVAFAPKPEMWATAGELGKEPVVAQTPKRPPGWRPLCLVGILERELLRHAFDCKAAEERCVFFADLRISANSLLSRHALIFSRLSQT